MGKTWLLARGLQQARGQGVSVVLTDLQELNASDFKSLEKFYHALGVARFFALVPKRRRLWRNRSISTPF